MYGNNTLEEVTMNLHAGPLQLAATSLILVSPFTKFALTLEPVARGVEEFAQKVRVSWGFSGERGGGGWHGWDGAKGCASASGSVTRPQNCMSLLPQLLFPKSFDCILAIMALHSAMKAENQQPAEHI